MVIVIGPTLSAHGGPPVGIGAGVGESVGTVGHASHDTGQASSTSGFPQFFFDQTAHVLLFGLPLTVIVTSPSESVHGRSPTGVGAGVGDSVGTAGHALHDTGQASSTPGLSHFFLDQSLHVLLFGLPLMVIVTSPSESAHGGPPTGVGAGVANPKLYNI